MYARVVHCYMFPIMIHNSDGFSANMSIYTTITYEDFCLPLTKILIEVQSSIHLYISLHSPQDSFAKEQ